VKIKEGGGFASPFRYFITKRLTNRRAGVETTGLNKTALDTYLTWCFKSLSPSLTFDSFDSKGIEEMMNFPTFEKKGN
jgi:hypothetical protein